VKRVNDNLPNAWSMLGRSHDQYQLQRLTVDGTLKQYVGDNLDSWWGEKALRYKNRPIRDREIHPLAPPSGGVERKSLEAVISENFLIFNVRSQCDNFEKEFQPF
jgi:hypothetical protein